MATPSRSRPYAYGPHTPVRQFRPHYKSQTSRGRTAFLVVHLETQLSTATATVPHIWNVATGLRASGSHRKRRDLWKRVRQPPVTVGGVAATVTAWTSGKLYVTVPAGAAGQYEVVATNAQEVPPGRFGAMMRERSLLAQGGAFVATTAVAITKISLSDFRKRGRHPADAVLGIVAVGYANADAAAGAALQINQTGHTAHRWSYRRATGHLGTAAHTPPRRLPGPRSRSRSASGPPPVRRQPATGRCAQLPQLLDKRLRGM